MSKIKLAHFLEKFPEVELPVILSEDTHLDFSKENDPLSDAMIEQFIGRYEAVEMDDLTEYIACFRIPDTKGFEAIVYWRAALLQYDYVLATYNPLGIMIDKRSIAGTKVKDNAIVRTIATIDEKHHILIAEGAETHSGGFDANATKSSMLEIEEDGFISE